jgi:hypothetical protein
MAKLALTLPTQSNIGRSGQVANVRLINAYAEDAGADAKNKLVIYNAPGLDRKDSDSLTGASRGMIELTSNELIHFTGNQIYSYDQGFVGTQLATIVGSGRLSLARNRATVPEIGIVTGSGQYYILSGGTLTQISDADLPTPNSIDYQDGFFLFGIEDGRIYSSDLEDGTEIQGDAFGTARSDSSNLVRVKSHAGFVYVFKQKGTEIWQSDPALAAENFVFAPIQQDIPIGCIAAFSIEELERGLVWVDNDGIVRYGRDGSAQRISTHAVERAIASLTDAQRRAIEAFTFSFHGHQYYTMSSASWTWQFDLVNGTWAERMSYGAARWLASSSQQYNGAYIVGSNSDGKIYQIDPETFDEGGENLVTEIWCAHSHNFPDAMLVDAFELDVISGVGQQSADDNIADPKVMIDYSDDGGATFEAERTGELGKIGERKRRIRMNNWGKVTETGRIWRIRSSAPVLRGTVQAYLHARPAT